MAASVGHCFADQVQGLRLPGCDQRLWDIVRYSTRDAFRTLRRLKDEGYPILNSYTYIDMILSGRLEYRCHWPKFNMPVEANGDVVDCMHWGTRPIANVREEPLCEILASPRLRALAGPAGEKCCRCVSLHRVEVSEVYDGNLEPLRSWVQAL